MLLWNSFTEILLCGTFPVEETKENMAQTISLLFISVLLMSTTKHNNQPKTSANWCHLFSHYSVTFRVVEGTWRSGSRQKHSAPAGAGERFCLSPGASQLAYEVQLRTLAASPLRVRVLKSLSSDQEPELYASYSTTSRLRHPGFREWLGFIHCRVCSVWCFEPCGSFWISCIDHGILDQYHTSALCLQRNSTQYKAPKQK